VSDFFSRLAARSVGDVPDARPAGGFGVSAAPTAAPAVAAAAPPVVRATPAAPEVRAATPEAPVEPAVPDQPIAESEPAPVELAEAVTSAKPRVAEREPEPVSARTQEPLAPAAQAEPRTSAAPVIVRATPVTAAAPVIRHVAETRLQRVHSVATVAADEPPVRVHIGRLEVRANLEQPPQKPKSRPERAAAEGLSLSEYLRGRKGA
jgi:hypothetical protein